MDTPVELVSIRRRPPDHRPGSGFAQLAGPVVEGPVITGDPNTTVMMRAGWNVRWDKQGTLVLRTGVRA